MPSSRNSLPHAAVQEGIRCFAAWTCDIRFTCHIRSQSSGIALFVACHSIPSVGTKKVDWAKAIFSRFR